MGKKGVKLILDTYGNFLGMEKGCIILKDKKGNTSRYPLFEAEITEVVLKGGNVVSTGVLSALGFWEVDVLIETRNGNPIAILKNLNDDSHVKTRICQYEATKNGKGAYIAKQIVISKTNSQNEVLKKYGLALLESNKVAEDVEGLDPGNPAFYRKLQGIEGKCAEQYFGRIFSLFPEELRPMKRKSFHAYDGVNNLFNLAYELLFAKCYVSLIKAHLETHLGFLHCNVFGRPSLVCDFTELYRYLVDDFLIEYSQDLKRKDFIAKTELFNEKKGKRIYLNDSKTKEMTKGVHGLFLKTVKIPRVRYGSIQEIESLIYEESLLLAKYLRNGQQDWTPRVVPLNKFPISLGKVPEQRP
jgi:CRISPR-associated protein Cas1